MRVQPRLASGGGSTYMRSRDTTVSVFVSQILNEDVMKKTCEDSQLCVIAVLPHILDTGEIPKNTFLFLLGVGGGSRTKSGAVKGRGHVFHVGATFTLPY